MRANTNIKSIDKAISAIYFAYSEAVKANIDFDLKKYLRTRKIVEIEDEFRKCKKSIARAHAQMYKARKLIENLPF